METRVLNLGIIIELITAKTGVVVKHKLELIVG